MQPLHRLTTAVILLSIMSTAQRPVASGLHLRNKHHIPSSGEGEIVGKPTMELDVEWVRVWTVKVFY